MPRGPYRLLRTEDREVPVLVCDARYDPEVDLTLFALKASDSLGLAPSSVRAYLYQLLAFASWADADPIAIREGWDRHGPPHAVRLLVDRYLRRVAGCDLTYKQDRYGLDGCFVRVGPQSTRSLAPLLAALRAYYELLRNKRRYPHPNPMESGQAVELRRAILRREADAFEARTGRARMPAVSGVDEPADAELPSTAFFRPVNGAWRPNIRADPLLSAKVLLAGERAGWGTQPILVARLLFRTGARIAEICGMTLLDWWRSSQFGSTVDLQNKGSRSLRVKTVVLDKATQKLLRDYVNHERSRYDQLGRGLAAFERLAIRRALDPAEPVFLTSRGTPLTPQHFRDYFWRPAMTGELAGVTPHAARHNMVTLHLAEIDRVAKTPKERDLLRTQFVAQMNWASGEAMLRVYDNRSLGRQVLGVMEKVQKEMTRREREYRRRDGAGGDVDAHASRPAAGEPDLLAALFGDLDEEQGPDLE